MFDRVDFEKLHIKRVKINFKSTKGCPSVSLIIYLLEVEFLLSSRVKQKIASIV